MRITLESDYALRIITALAVHNGLTDAKALADETQVTQRFALKILHKLVQGDFVTSQKGARGGYMLKRGPDEITLKDVIELIDGPIEIVRCLGSDEVCTLNHDKTACVFHHIFNKISFDMSKKLGSITIADILTKNYSV